MKFTKVIYFDESSVADFIQIVAGGTLKRTTEFITEVNTNAQIDVKAEAGTGSTDSKGLPKLFDFLGLKLGASMKSEVYGDTARSRMVKNILENTLLADFVDLIKNDEKKSDKNKLCKGVTLFENTIVYPALNSFSFFMLAAPYLTMLKGDIPIQGADGEQFNLDISKIEEAIQKGRGYYEFIAVHKEEEIILRFNIGAFRNNYTMSDLPKMNLNFYAIKVGETNIDKLQIEVEFQFGTNNYSRADYANLSSGVEDTQKRIKVYDVLLAGVVE
ncbi:MAG: DUF6414 family protein [Oscillospiraceae bacterium]|nr:DUF6414 family protein [Oscillospiraceae bacterium]